MRLRDLIRDLERDPLLKVGAWAMVVALGFAIVVAVGASLDRPMEVAVANAATAEPKPATGPLVRTDPGITPWVERDIPPPKPKATPSPTTPAVDPRPASVPKPTEQPNPKPKQRASTSGNNPLQTGDQTPPRTTPAITISRQAPS